jgi:hypothetical protein
MDSLKNCPEDLCGSRQGDANGGSCGAGVRAEAPPEDVGPLDTALYREPGCAATMCPDLRVSSYAYTRLRPPVAPRADRCPSLPCGSLRPVNGLLAALFPRADRGVVPGVRLRPDEAGRGPREAVPAASPREPQPGELVRCCAHLHGDVELREADSRDRHWRCRCCGIEWHWTKPVPSSRVIPEGL